MSIYLILSLVLLAAMAYLVLRPFLETAPVVLPPAASVATAATPVAATVAAPAPARTTSAQPQTAQVAGPSSDDLRANVEAAIAARKAAMVRHSCSGCGAPVDAGDAFCRSCGTRVEEG